MYSPTNLKWWETNPPWINKVRHRPSRARLSLKTTVKDTVAKHQQSEDRMPPKKQTMMKFCLWRYNGWIEGHSRRKEMQDTNDYRVMSKREHKKDWYLSKNAKQRPHSAQATENARNERRLNSVRQERKRAQNYIHHEEVKWWTEPFSRTWNIRSAY